MNNIKSKNYKTVNNPRLFIAFHINEAEKVQLIKLSNKLKTQNQKIQWTLKENLHITLQFLGNLSLFKAEKLLEAIHQLKNFKYPSILKTEKLIALPNNENPKVIALSVKKTKPLMQLESESARLARKLNIKISSYPYLPHLTIGHLKNNPDISSFIKTPIEPIILHPRKIVLFQSAESNILKYSPLQSIKI